MLAIDGRIWFAWHDNLLSAERGEEMLRACAAACKAASKDHVVDIARQISSHVGGNVTRWGKLRASVRHTRVAHDADLRSRGGEVIMNVVEKYDAPDVRNRDQIVDIAAEISLNHDGMSATDLAIREKGKMREMQVKEDKLQDMLCVASYGETCATNCSSAKRRGMVKFVVIAAIVVAFVGAISSIVLFALFKANGGGTAAAPTAMHIADLSGMKSAEIVVNLAEGGGRHLK